MLAHKRQSFIIVVSSILLIGLFALTWYQFKREARIIINKVIIEDVIQLKTIFDTINQECGILNFDHDRNYIDFLTVKSFVSSEVGSMNLEHPEKWGGPYVQDNPTMQSKKYEIVRTKSGYYIVPGAGVQLSQGKIMGRDVVITPQTNMKLLMSKKGSLWYEGKPLCARVTTRSDKSPSISRQVDPEF